MVFNSFKRFLTVFNGFYYLNGAGQALRNAGMAAPAAEETLRNAGTRRHSCFLNGRP
jgi:hypothetical protein